MAFLKFNTKDNAQGQLLASINSSVTAIVVKSGQGALYPASNFIVTLTEVTDGVVTKLEKCLCTSRSGDTLTVTRGYDGSTAQSFTADDFATLMVTSAVVQDIQDEITDLNTKKLNVAGGLRTALTNWRLFFSNGSGAETALALGTAGQVLQSNGASSNPTFVSPSVDINGLANDDAAPTSNDKFLWYKNGIGNRKRSMIASETVMGVVERATDAEVETGTDTTRYVSPKHLADHTKSHNHNHVFSDTETITVTHGLGRVPNVIECHATIRVNTTSPEPDRFLSTGGSRTPVGNKCISMIKNTGSGEPLNMIANNTYAFYCQYNTTIDPHHMHGQITNVNSTTYQLVVTKLRTGVTNVGVHLTAS